MTKKLQIVEILIKDLKPAEYNPRQATEKEVEDLKESLKRFGFVEPIVVNSAPKRKNVIIGGHFRVRIAKDMGIDKVPIVYVNIPDIKKEQELNLRLNKNLGHWDYDLLANYDEEMLLDVGWNNEELDKIFQIDKKDADEVPKVRKTNIKLGQLFELGEHRLMCGDVRKVKDIRKLAQKKVMKLCFTSPPYNIDPFGGSGTTLIACERLNRRCYMSDNLKSEEYINFNIMEIDPQYCQVIIDRWEKYTGKTAKKG